LKHYDNEGQPAADLPVVEWACRNLLYAAQEQLHGFLRNFPNRFLAGLMRVLIFPRGLTYFAPSDRLSRQVADLVTAPTETRLRLGTFAYTTLTERSPLGALQEVLLLADAAEALEKRIRDQGVKTGKVTALDLPGRIAQAMAAGLLSASEGEQLAQFDRKVMQLLRVDDFAPQELIPGAGFVSADRPV
ncbi:MAG TPA: acyl-CoA dehydrogenase domain-containing protein, partial [Steroidobacteraceae bacterium]|nr:acyl-CoA dehydrogenase domain-containing protein [Steroidobacteraceae bacterium]